MKVLYLAPEGGSGRLTGMSFIDEELVALARRGIEPHVLAPDIARDEVVDGIPKRAVRGITSRRSAAWFGARHAAALPLRPALRQPAYSLYVLKAEAAAARLAKDEGFDLIHSHFGAFGGLGGRLAAASAKRPLVSSFRGMDLACEPAQRYGLRQNPLFDAQLRRLLAYADRTLYVSDYLRRIGIELGARPERAHTVLKGVDLERFAPRVDAAAARARLQLDGFVVLTVASLLPRKGIDLALRAIRMLAQDHTVQYVVCGSGPERDRLMALVRELGIEKRVRFAGRVSRDVVADYFASADVFVMTSVNEGSGNVYLEAQASAVPAISCDSGGPPEYIRDGETGFTVPCGDAAVLAERIQRLIEDPGLRARMGRAARHWMEEGFAYYRMEDDILRAYALAVSGG